MCLTRNASILYDMLGAKGANYDVKSKRFPYIKTTLLIDKVLIVLHFESHTFYI